MVDDRHGGARPADGGVLFVHAHPREGGLLRAEPDLRVLETGVGKAAAAAAVAAELARQPAALVCAVGICGSYPGRIAAGEVLIEVLDACLVGTAVFGDEGAADEEGFRSLRELELADRDEWPAHARVTAAIAQAFGLPTVRATTVSTCTGEDRLAGAVAARSRGDVETMESAAVALACERAGVPWVELRVVSNHAGDRARSEWRLGEAADRAQELALRAWRDGLLEVGGA